MTGWKCSCGIVNFTTDAECKRCGSARPTEDSSIVPQALTNDGPTLSTMLLCVTCRDFARGQDSVCPTCKGPWTIAYPVYPVALPLLRRSVFGEVLAAILVSAVILAVVAFFLTGILANLPRR